MPHNPRYPYTHHGPSVHGSKLLDYYISEHSLRQDAPELFDDIPASPLRDQLAEARRPIARQPLTDRINLERQFRPKQE